MERVQIYKAWSLEEKLALSSCMKGIYLEEGYILSPQQEKLFPDKYDSTPETICWYAARKDEIVGGVRIHTGITLPMNHFLNSAPFLALGNIVEISRLCVKRQVREQRVAQQLVSASCRYAKQERADFILLLAAAGTQHDDRWWKYRSLFLHTDQHHVFTISPNFSWKEPEKQLYNELSSYTILGWYERLGAKPAGHLLLHPFFNIVALPMYAKVSDMMLEVE